jgi:hypothetical protein
MTYQLIRDHISHDTVEALETLTEAARQGQVVGIVYGVVLKGRKFFVDTAGSLTRDVTFARGVVAAIDDELCDILHGRADAGPTIT